mmetsp:Transcript_48245/g.104592  ORF Transcript_48245/g.104592 Transcript_48245/m.104592 type:complete len:297 (-) Transcript_48245:81-971(-)
MCATLLHLLRALIFVLIITQSISPWRTRQPLYIYVGTQVVGGCLPFVGFALNWGNRLVGKTKSRVRGGSVALIPESPAKNGEETELEDAIGWAAAESEEESLSLPREAIATPTMHPRALTLARLDDESPPVAPESQLLPEATDDRSDDTLPSPPPLDDSELETPPPPPPSAPPPLLVMAAPNLEDEPHERQSKIATLTSLLGWLNRTHLADLRTRMRERGREGSTQLALMTDAEVLDSSHEAAQSGSSLTPAWGWSNHDETNTAWSWSSVTCQNCGATLPPQSEANVCEPYCVHAV